MWKQAIPPTQPSIRYSIPHPYARHMFVLNCFVCWMCLLCNTCEILLHPPLIRMSPVFFSDLLREALTTVKVGVLSGVKCCMHAFWMWHKANVNLRCIFKTLRWNSKGSIQPHRQSNTDSSYFPDSQASNTRFSFSTFVVFLHAEIIH